MKSGFLLPLDKHGHQLPESVEDGKRHVRASRETVADGGAQVEWIRDASMAGRASISRVGPSSTPSVISLPMKYDKAGTE